MSSIVPAIDSDMGPGWFRVIYRVRIELQFSIAPRTTYHENKMKNKMLVLAALLMVLPWSVAHSQAEKWNLRGSTTLLKQGVSAQETLGLALIGSNQIGLKKLKPVGNGVTRVIADGFVDNPAEKAVAYLVYNSLLDRVAMIGDLRITGLGYHDLHVSDKPKLSFTERDLNRLMPSFEGLEELTAYWREQGLKKVLVAANLSAFKDQTIADIFQLITVGENYRAGVNLKFFLLDLETREEYKLGDYRYFQQASLLHEPIPANDIERIFARTAGIKNDETKNTRTVSRLVYECEQQPVLPFTHAAYVQSYNQSLRVVRDGVLRDFIVAQFGESERTANTLQLLRSQLSAAETGGRRVGDAPESLLCAADEVAARYGVQLPVGE